MQQEPKVVEIAQAEEKIVSQPIEETKPCEKTDHTQQASEPIKRQVTVDHLMKEKDTAHPT